jgi:arginine decarboxylase
MSGALPIYMPPVYNEKLGIWNPVSPEILEKFIRHPYAQGQKPRMLVLTTCTYEGILYPIRKIAELCEEQGILFYADEAWAPYLRFHPYYAQMEQETGEIRRYNALDGGAHFTVHSTHKALAAFSQASMIHVSRRFRELLESGEPQWDWLMQKYPRSGSGSYRRFRHDLSEILRYWHSTSPHYPMIATLDLSGIQMGLEGLRLLDERLMWIEDFRQDVDRLTGGAMLGLAEMVGADQLPIFADYRKDPLKIVLGYRDEKSGAKFREALLEAHIQWEKSSVGCIEFLVTIGTFLDHLKQLKQVIMDHRDLLGRPDASAYRPEDLNVHKLKGQVCMLPRDAFEAESELVRLEDSEGRISAQMLVPYPPGVPVFLPGLRITADMIAMVQSIIRQGQIHDVHGILAEDGVCSLRVVKGDGGDPVEIDVPQDVKGL